MVWRSESRRDDNNEFVSLAKNHVVHRYSEYAKLQKASFVPLMAGDYMPVPLIELHTGIYLLMRYRNM